MKKIFMLCIMISLVFAQDIFSQPVARCKPITVFLSRVSASEFEVIVNPSEVDDSSFSSLGLFTLSLSQSRFIYTIFQSDVGVHTVDLIAKDINGDSAICTTTITVLLPASPPPIASCINDTVYLDEHGVGQLIPAQLNNSSTSFSGTLQLAVTQSLFTCSDRGVVTDTLIAMDAAGTDRCVSLVTVVDTIPPVVRCKDAIVQLDQNGLAFLVPSTFDDGSYDACGIADLQLGISLLDCSDIGEKQIPLIAIDSSGNSDTCFAKAFVFDFVEPEAVCNNTTVILNSSGIATVSASAINASTDACGITSFSIDKTSFSKFELGENKVILTVADSTGNVAQCEAKVTVTNVIPPIANCKNINVRLKNGFAEIVTEDIDSNSSSFMGIDTMWLSKTTFGYAETGIQNVILTVQDLSGLTNTCTSLVNVTAVDSITGRIFNSTNTPVFGTNNFPLLEIDEAGLIWAGSSGNGLFVYQNNNWGPAVNSFGNSGFVVRALRKHPLTGDVWVGMSKTSPCLGQSGGLYQYSDKNTLVNRFLASQAISAFSDLPSDVIRCITIHPDFYDVWAGCTPQICTPGNLGGLAQLQDGQTIFNQLNTGMPPVSNGDRSVYALATGRDNLVYAAVAKSCGSSCTAPYIIIRNAGSGTFVGTYDNTNTPLPLSTSSSALAIRSLFVDSHNRLWVGGELNGLGVRDDNGWHFLTPSQIPYPSGQFVNFDAITEGADGTIYIGTANGLLTFRGEDVTDPAKWKLNFLKATNLASQAGSLQNVGSVRQDEKGNYWIATRAGIFYQKDPVVYDLVVSIQKKSIIKRPFNNIEVQAYIGNSPVGTPVRTNTDGEFLSGLDLQLSPSQSYKLKFRYTRRPFDTMDRNMEYEVTSYQPGQTSLEDIMMPVTVLKQTRTLMDKMSPQPPSVSLKYDLKIFDFWFNKTFSNRAVFDMLNLEASLISFSSITDADAPRINENIARGYLALYLHNEILNHSYDITKLRPKVLVSVVSMFFATKASFKKAEEKKKILSANQESEKADMEAVKQMCEVAGDMILQFLEYQIQRTTDEKQKEALEKVKTGVELGVAGIGHFFDYEVDPEETIDQVREKVVELIVGKIKEVITNAAFMAMYEGYISSFQEQIDLLGTSIAGPVASGTFEQAANNLLNLMSELNQYSDDVSNRVEVTLANLESAGAYKTALEAGVKTSNDQYQDASLYYLSAAAGGIKNLVTSFSDKFTARSFYLARLAQAIWQGGNLAVAWEESFRGSLTLGYNQSKANEIIFNPAANVQSPIAPAAAPNANHQPSAPSQNTNDFSSALQAYNSAADSVVQLVNLHQDSLAGVRLNSLITYETTVKELYRKCENRFIAIADSASLVLPDFSESLNSLTNTNLQSLIARAIFYKDVRRFIADTALPAIQDTVALNRDSVILNHTALLDALNTLESVAQNFSVSNKLLITHKIGSNSMAFGSTADLTVAVKNYGTQAANQVYIKVMSEEGFSFQADSIAIGTILPNDSAGASFTISAPAADTFSVIKIRVSSSTAPTESSTFFIATGETCSNRYFADIDGDGFGDRVNYILSCNQPNGFVIDSTDCNDLDRFLNPNAIEICNSSDDNCNGSIDENAVRTFYKDQDGDGYGISTDTIRSCSAGAGYVALSGDCVDTLVTTHPFAVELCNGRDDNCNGQIDEGVLNKFFRDFDGDGFGNALNFISNCFKLDGYVEDSTDCNDFRADINPSRTEICNGLDDDCDGNIDEGCPGNIFFADRDVDGFGNPLQSITVASSTPPTGYVTDNTDCRDTDSNIHPGVIEICNNLDDNCDGQIDEGVLLSFYQDADGDGFGNLSVSIQACSSPSGYVSNHQDCNDSNPFISPFALDSGCNGIDDNCNGVIDDGPQTTFYRDADQDGYGNPLDTTQACTVPAGYVENNFDCDDSRQLVHPNGIEVCNGLDDNCNGSVDEGVQLVFYKDTDGDGYGNLLDSILGCSPPAGYVSNSSDCNDSNGNIHPGVSEICNGIDDNCNGQTDEGVQITFFRDIDGDGFGNSLDTIQACSVPAGFVLNNSDCNDQNISIHPGTSESCNGLDDNCNGQIDEGVQTTFYRDQDGDGFGNVAVTTQACSLPGGFVTNSSDCNDNDANVNPGAIEVCNLIDDNCNGQIDEGVQTLFYRDLDGDGFGNLSITLLACSVPNGFVTNAADCNDGHSSAYPGATEICNGIDDNCNGLIDEGVKALFYRDLDSDGYGDRFSTSLACVAPAGFVSDSTDCMDSNPTVFPGAVEICNGLDDNCNGIIDEGCTGMALTVKMFIEGFYSGFGQMNNNGQGGSLVMSSVPNANPLDADTVSISLVDPQLLTTVATAKGILRTNGLVTVQFSAPVVSGQNYYLQINHRNAIETWSSVPVTISANAQYDFTTARTKAYGANQFDLGDGNFAFYSGDINRDELIDINDFNIMANDLTLMLTGYQRSDVNGDGIVESVDFTLLQNNIITFVVRP